MSHFGIFASGAGTGSCRGAGDGAVPRQGAAAPGIRVRQVAVDIDGWRDHLGAGTGLAARAEIRRISGGTVSRLPAGKKFALSRSAWSRHQLSAAVIASRLTLETDEGAVAIT